MVIDDGWQIARDAPYNGGPWDRGNERFPDMPGLAAAMKDLGVRPGIWVRLTARRAFLGDGSSLPWVLHEFQSRVDEDTARQWIDHVQLGLPGVHAVDTVERADDILILEGGQVIETGPRRQLAADPDSHFARLLHTGIEEVLT